MIQKFIAFALLLSSSQMIVLDKSTDSGSQEGEPQSLRISVIGDSQSCGFCSPKTGGIIPSWPRELRTKLALVTEKNITVNNFALGLVTPLKEIKQDEKNTVGRTLIPAWDIVPLQEAYDTLHKRSIWNQVKFQKFKASKPDVVVLMLNLNFVQWGFPDKLARDEMELVRYIQNMDTHPDVFIVVQPEMRGVSSAQILLQLANVLGIDKNHVVRMDKFTKKDGQKITIDPKFSCDEGHYNELGNNLIANMVVDSLRKANYVPKGQNLEAIIAPGCEKMFDKASKEFKKCKEGELL